MASQRVDGLERRRALTLGAWSAVVASAGAVVARARSGGSGRSAGAVRAGSTSASRPIAVSATPRASTGVANAASSAAGAAASSAAGGSTSGLLSGEALALHAARRLTYGPTPALVQEITSSGLDAWLDQQLTGRFADGDLDVLLGRLADLSAPAASFRQTNRSQIETLEDLRLGTVLRAVLSQRQLFEVMVGLWHDHLPASSLRPRVAWHLPTYDASIRRHALGRFADLLQATTSSAAMLEFLDGASSTQPDVNENHARELLELHTVGMGNYDETDVQGASRVLSGWTIDRRTLSVVFDPDRHHTGPGTVLGWSTPGRAGADGAADLDRLVHHLARQRTTAERIATVLARRFIADEPDGDVVGSIADAYLANDTDISATLRHLVGTDAFRSGGAPTVRRPLDSLAAVLRGTGADFDVPNALERLVPVGAVDGLDDLLGPVMESVGDLVDPVVAPVVDAGGPRPISRSFDMVLRQEGQRLFAAPSPAGHPITGAAWSTGNGLLQRWTIAGMLAEGRLDGVRVAAGALAPNARTVGELVDTVAKRLFASAPSAATRAAAVAVTGRPESSTFGDDAARAVVAFLLASPEMQIR